MIAINSKAFNTWIYSIKISGLDIIICIWIICSLITLHSFIKQIVYRDRKMTLTTFLLTLCIVISGPVGLVTLLVNSTINKENESIGSLVLWRAKDESRDN